MLIVNFGGIFMAKEVKTELSLLQRNEDIISDVQKEILEEEISELHSIKENDINISTVYIFDNGEELESKVYFRNGLNRDVNFEFVPLILLNSKEEEIASNTFDLREMGNIPPGGARPWKIYFDKKLVKMEKFENEHCKIVFDHKLKAVNYADIEYEQIPQMFEGYRSVFEKFLYELPRIEKGQLSISTFDLVLSEDGKIIITLVIRNSTGKDIQLNEIPITIKDENDTIVTSNKFLLDNFMVKTMKAKICNLVIETDMKVENGVSMKDKWKVIFQS